MTTDDRGISSNIARPPSGALLARASEHPAKLRRAIAARARYDTDPFVVRGRGDLARKKIEKALRVLELPAARFLAGDGLHEFIVRPTSEKAVAYFSPSAEGAPSRFERTDEISVEPRFPKLTRSLPRQERERLLKRR